MKKLLLFILPLAAPAHAQLTSINGNLWIPNTPNIAAGVYAVNAAFLMDATAEKVAVVLEIPTTGTIEKIGFRLGTVTEEDTLKCGLYALDASGDPDTATAYGGMTAGTITFADADDNTWQLCTLGGNATATRGNKVGVVIEYNSFVDGNLSLNMIQSDFGGNSSSVGFPYVDHFTASWGKQTGVLPVVSLEYSTALYNYIEGVYPVLTVTNTTYNTGSAADEIALRFQLPFPARLSCFNIRMTPGTAADFDVILYTGTTATETYSWDGDVRAGGANFHRGCFTTPRDIAANTAYRVALKPTTATSIVLQRWTTSTAATMGMIGGGVQFYESTRVDAGAWTDTTTNRPMIYLGFDQLDAGAGGGGGTRGYTFVQ